MAEQKVKDLKKENKQLKQDLKKPSLVKIKNRQLLNEINSRGYLTIKKELPQDIEYDILTPTKTFKVGVVTDTHIGSRFQQITHLRQFYQDCKNEGIKTIFHCGDLMEGNGKLYRGQQFEMFDIKYKHYTTDLEDTSILIKKTF